MRKTPILVNARNFRPLIYLRQRCDEYALGELAPHIPQCLCHFISHFPFCINVARVLNFLRLHDCSSGALVYEYRFFVQQVEMQTHRTPAVSASVWGLVESHLVLKVLFQFSKKYNFTFKRPTPQVAADSALEHAAAPRHTPTTPWKEPQLFSFVVVDRNRERDFGATRRRRRTKKLRHRCRTRP
jgi:hypothetical protein